MVREIITINIGQAGIQMANTVWEQYVKEHNLNEKGVRVQNANDKNDDDDTSSMHTFFEETHQMQYVPRNISIDLEPNVIDDVKNSRLGALYNPDFLIHGKEDAANNFARGFYTVGREYIDIFCDRLHGMVERCDHLQGFIFNHAVAGGTGSGLGSLILEKCAFNYKRKAKIGFEVYPSSNLSNCIVEPYNAMFTTHYLCDSCEVNLYLDNQALYQACKSKLKLETPDHQEINSLIAKISSSITASLRFKGELNVDLTDFQTNLVPFPRLHFMLTSMAPVMPAKTSNDDYEMPDLTARDLGNEAVDPKSYFCDFGRSEFDSSEDQFMSILMNFRGDITAKDANHCTQWLKAQHKVQFVEWCPTGFRMGLNSQPIATLDNDILQFSDKNCVMIGNNTCMYKPLRDNILRKADILYSQRAFVHWYVGEGMEEGEFDEANENLKLLEKDYLDVLHPGNTTDEDDNADDNEDF